MKRNVNRMRFFEKSLMKRFGIKMLKKIKMIFENKNYSKSSQSKNLTLSKLVHLQNNDKISLEKNENLENTFYRNFTNQWENEKFRSVEFATSLRLSAKNWIMKFHSSYFQIRHSLCNCETCSIFGESWFDSCDDRKSNYCLSQWY
jgi:hypothetical protein